MGVYHLMGLGLSPGAVAGPLSHLAHRYRRRNADDQLFFACYGEVKQREAGEKVGDIQALVLFTTREVLSGEVLAYEHVDNPPAHRQRTEEIPWSDERHAAQPPASRMAGYQWWTATGHDLLVRSGSAGGASAPPTSGGRRLWPRWPG